jgi:hypothetical protein
MEQYTATQIKRIIKALEDQMSSASGKTFDKMERARRDLKDWDGTGSLPHEKMLWELNVLDGTSALEPGTNAVTEAPIKEAKGTHVVHPQESVTHKQDELEVEPDSPSLEEAQEICQALRGMMETVAQNKEQRTYFHEFDLEIENWIISRRRGKLPRRDVLKQLGLWPKTVEKKETETIAPSQAEIIKPEEGSGQREIERLISVGQLYDAVKMLERRGDAQGADKRLNSLRAQLEAQTRRLVQKARRVEKEQSADFSAQKVAWRAVQDFNPEDQEVHEALRAVEQAEIRADLKKQVKNWLETAKEAARQDNLPTLNEALMETQAVLSQVKKEASWQDLQEMVGGSVQSIEKLRSETRDRLGAMATAEGQHLYREAYKATRELIERPSPPPTILSEHGEEVSLKSYWPHIRQQFVKWLQGKAAEYVTAAHLTAQTSPQLAREKLVEALQLLQDDILTKDDGVTLEPAKINITDDIKKIDERIAIYEKARNLVVEGQSRSLSPSQRLEHLRKAYELFPSYTGISQYIETAENDFAGELARKGNEAVNEARHLAAQDKHDDALGVLQTVNQTITTAFQRFSEGSPLQLAIHALDDEKKRIQDQKRLYDNMLLLLPKVEEHIKDYDVSKNAGSLQAARALFAEIQKSHPGHRLVQDVNAELVKRQGDPDNWDTGQTAYQNQDWEAAGNAFKKISSAFPRYDEAQQLLQRARAAFSTLSGRDLEANKEWTRAITAYQRAVHLFDGDPALGYPVYGTDPVTISFAEESRSALERLKKIHLNDQKVDELIKECKGLFESAKRTANTRRLPVDKVEPIPLFQKIDSMLRNAASDTATTRTDKLYELLDEVHETWLETYLAGMELVIGQSQKNKALLRKANALANELEEVGLLSGHEALACQLQADLLDLEYSGMGDYRTGSNLDLEKMEDNRRERLNVQRRWPYPTETDQIRKHEEKLRDLERTIREIVDRRMRSDLERRLNQAITEYGSSQENAQAAYSSVLQEMENDVRLSGSVNSTTSLIRIAWKAHEWQKAESLARRMRENTGADYAALSDQWILLGKAAQSFADDNVDDGLLYSARLPKNLSADLRVAKSEIENETVLRLVADAKKDAALNTDQGFMDAAHKYALAYKLSPNHREVADGLQKIGARVEKTILSLCSAAGSLQLRGVTMDDLNQASRDAHEQYAALSNFANVAKLLKLKPAQVDVITDAVQNLEAKSRVWDGVKTLLDNFDRDLGVILNQPERIDPRRNTGGWNLDDLERHLQDARKLAGRDVQLSRLIDSKLADWNYRRDVAVQLNKSVIALMDCVAEEDFDQLISRAVQLDEDWKKAQREYGFEGLGMLVFEIYDSLGRAETPLQHRDIAIRQKQNLAEWTKWVVGVKDKLSTLADAQRDLQFSPGNWHSLGPDARARLMEKLFSRDEGMGLPLRDVISQCNKGRDVANVFQDYLNSRPTQRPLSKKAQDEADQVSTVSTEHLNEFLDYLPSLRSEAEKRITDLEKNLLSLRGAVKNIEGLSKKYGKVNTAAMEGVRRQLDTCKQIDPFSREVADLEQKLFSYM